jgi:alpha-L-fucosidase 2
VPYPSATAALGAIVFGNVDTERLQLNEDTLWAGGPHDYSNPEGAAALPEIQRLVFEDEWAQAQDLINRTMLGSPAGQLAKRFSVSESSVKRLVRRAGCRRRGVPPYN